MKIKQINLLLGLLFALPFLFIGCKDHPCPNENPDTFTPHPLTETEKANYPYNRRGQDTLQFKNDNGEIATLYGLPMDSFGKRGLVPRSQSPDCTNEDYHDFEYNSFEYRGNHPDLNHVGIIMFTDFINPRNPSKFSIYSFYNFILMGESVYRAELSYFNDGKEYIYPITIDGKEFKTLPIGNLTDTLFYNKQDGIIKIKTKTHNWYKTN